MKTSILSLFVTIFFVSHITLAGGTQLAAITFMGGSHRSGCIIRYTSGNANIGHYDLPSDSDTNDPTYDAYGPTGSLIQASNGLMYGMTFGGGTDSFGTLFQYNYVTDTFIVLYNFNVHSGGLPHGSMLQASDGKLYGLTSHGGANQGGTLFSYTIGSDSVDVLSDLPDTAYPFGTLIQSANGKLYGMTQNNGINYKGGTIFEYDISSGIYTVKYNLPSEAYPYGTLLEVGADTLYGLTYLDGLNNGGTLFRFIVTTGAYDTLYNFHPQGDPLGSLIRGTDGKLYGAVSDVFASTYGNLFSYDISAHTYKDIYDCNGVGCSRVYGSLFQASDSMIYGLMNLYVFRYNVGSATFMIEANLDSTTGDYPRYGNFTEYYPFVGTGITRISETNIKIYGKTGAIAIERPDTTPATVIVTNLLGQQIINMTTNSNSLSLPVSMTDVVYIVRVIQNGNQVVRKVLVR